MSKKKLLEVNVNDNQFTSCIITAWDFPKPAPEPISPNGEKKFVMIPDSETMAVSEFRIKDVMIFVQNNAKDKKARVFRLSKKAIFDIHAAILEMESEVGEIDITDY